VKEKFGQLHGDDSLQKTKKREVVGSDEEED